MKAFLQDVIKDNNGFISGRSETHFEEFQDGQTPRATVVMCADSRITDITFSKGVENNIFMIRNIGDQYATSEGSVEYGVNVLQTPVLVFIGHSDCGAIKAAKEDYSKLPRNIKSELVTIKVNNGEDAKQGIISNVNFQVKEALIAFDQKVKDKALVIIGAVYDFSGHYGAGKGKLIITNINGETNPEAIKKSPLLEGVSGLSTLPQTLSSHSPKEADSNSSSLSLQRYFLAFRDFLRLYIE